MMDEEREILLPLHREYSEAEHLAAARDKIKRLEITFDALRLINNNLEKENFRLKQKIKNNDLNIPESLEGKTVSAKAFYKMQRRLQMWEENFWRVQKELDELKNQPK